MGTALAMPHEIALFGAFTAIVRRTIRTSVTSASNTFDARADGYVGDVEETKHADRRQRPAHVRDVDDGARRVLGAIGMNEANLEGTAIVDPIETRKNVNATTRGRDITHDEQRRHRSDQG